jgi:hypothetical protein
MVGMAASPSARGSSVSFAVVAEYRLSLIGEVARGGILLVVGL